MDSLELAELDGGPVTNRPSIFLHLEEGLRRSPNGPAITVMHQPAGHLSELLGRRNGVEKANASSCLVWSYDELLTAALRVAAGLRVRGVRSGATVATFISNSVECAVILWACAILKVTLVPLDPGALDEARGAELENFLRKLRPDVVMVESTVGVEAVDRSLRRVELEKVMVKICFEAEELAKGATGGWISLLTLALEAADCALDGTTMLEDARHDDPDRVALILFTSGTSSGKPKGCPRHVAGLTHVIETNPWDFNDVRSAPAVYIVTTVNFRTIFPTFAMATWKAGGTVVIPPPSPSGGFNVEGTLDAIEQHGVTTILLIPVMLHLLVAHLTFTKRKLKSLGAVMIGADIITKDIFAKVRDAFPNADRVSCAHGMTETGGVVTWPFHGLPVDQISRFGDIYPIGVPVPGVRVRVLNAETGAIARRGETGEICFSAEAATKHYLDNVSEHSFFSDEQGTAWFRTGDSGTVDKDGVVFILGRIKDIIKRGGIPITPAALESCIASFTGSAVCVVAAAHPELGQVPYAVMKDMNGKADCEIKARVLEMFGKDYELAGVVTLEELGLEDFPLNATAKIQKFELERRVASLRNGST